MQLDQLKSGYREEQKAKSDLLHKLKEEQVTVHFMVRVVVSVCCARVFQIINNQGQKVITLMCQHFSFMAPLNNSLVPRPHLFLEVALMNNGCAESACHMISIATEGSAIARLVKRFLAVIM